MPKRLVNVRVDDDLLSKAREEYARLGLTLTDVITGALQAYADGTVPDPEQDGTGLQAAPAEPPQRRRPVSKTETESCPHPRARIQKGLCYSCGTYVG